MKTLLMLSFAAACLMCGQTASYAQCTNNPLLQPDSTFPALRGRLVYHSYVTYNDGSSNLFLKDFTTNELKQLNQPEWNILDPMNAHFSPNGRWLTFMGRQNTQWNIFIWQVGSLLSPINLSNHTELTGGSSEDPKFSADGNYIVYKQNGDIALAHLNFINANAPYADVVWKLTNNGYNPEESMPYLSPDNKNVYYSRGAGANSDIYRLGLKVDANIVSMTTPILVASRQGLAEYYPGTQGSTLFFVGWKDAISQRDQIYSMYTGNKSNSQPSQLSMNDCNADNSDPTAIDSSYVLFSGTRNSNSYNLFLGNASTGNVWSLNQFGVNQVGKNQLGSTYTSMR